MTFQLQPPGGGDGPQFSIDGRFVAWGRADGSVSLVELNKVQRRPGGNRTGLVSTAASARLND